VIAALGAPLLRALCAPRAARFAAALADCAAAQRRTLARLVSGAAATEYGRQFGLRADDDADAYRAKLPPTSYAELQPWISRAQATAANVLAPGRVRRFEPTSGSGGATKLIPYNDALIASFRSLFAIWAHDLLSHALHPRSGRVFISVSPSLAQRRQARHDADYLGNPMRLLLAPFLVAPEPSLANDDPTRFRDALARALLACADLEVISVWSPTYLLVLLAHVEARRAELSAGLPAPRRRLLERDPVPWPLLWPRLQLVSCWAAAAAAAPAQSLARQLPHALLQAKGLLATEGPITVPLVPAGGCVPLVDEVFVELEAADGSLWLLHEAQPGHDYALLLTQPAGLLRYRLGDRVRMTGRWRDAPLLDFVGRVDAVTDLVGEKLHEDQVAAALRALVAADAFALLVPEGATVPARYRLVTDVRDAQLGERLDAALQAAYRYREARVLGQLATLEVSALPDARRAVHDFLIADGMAAGDIKDIVLLRPLERAARLLAALDRAPARTAR
jgi:hypothetical protein